MANQTSECKDGRSDPHARERAVTTQWAWNDEHTGAHDMPLGERIRALRTEHGWSQADLAAKLGADTGQISRYETAKMTPGADVVVKLAEALDVSCDHLLVDDAPRRPFRAPDTNLGDRLNGLNELTDDDWTALNHILDALLAKNRVRNALRDAS